MDAIISEKTPNSHSIRRTYCPNYRRLESFLIFHGKGFEEFVINKKTYNITKSNENGRTKSQ